MNKIDEIRSEMKNGKSISEVCQEHDLTFAELTNLMKKKYEGPKPSPSTGHMYITHRHGVYLIRKGNVYYGSYRTLDDAIKVRDYFMFSRWDKRNIDKACEKVGVERIKKGGQ